MDTKDPGYDTLRRVRRDALDRALKRIDFISQLPVDIVLTTLIPMFMNKGDPLDACKPCPYFHVSMYGAVVLFNPWVDLIL